MSCIFKEEVCTLILSPSYLHNQLWLAFYGDNHILGLGAGDLGKV